MNKSYNTDELSNNQLTRNSKRNKLKTPANGTMTPPHRELNTRLLEIIEISPIQEVAKVIQNAIQLK